MKNAKAPSSRVLALGLAAGVLGGAVIMLYLLYDSLFTIVLGFGLAYLCDPLADWFEAKGVNRTVAVWIIMGSLVGGALLAAALIVPGLFLQAQEFSNQFPRYLVGAVERIDGVARQFGVEIPQDRDEMLLTVRSWLENVSVAALKPLGRFAGRFFSSAAGMLVSLLNLLVVPVIFFYFLRDIDILRVKALDLAPQRYRHIVKRSMDQTDRVFSGFVRGQVIVAFLLACIYSVGLGLLGVRFGVVIGITAGLLNIVPYLGVLIGLLLSLVMALVDFTSIWKLAGVLGVFGVAQCLEGFFITPSVVGDKVGLTPFETILALIILGEIGGLLGLVLAIPLAGCAKAHLIDAIDAYRRSPLYKDA